MCRIPLTLLAALLAFPVVAAGAPPHLGVTPASTLDPKPGNLAAALDYQGVYLGSTGRHTLQTLPGWLGQAGALAGSALRPPAPSLPGLRGYLNDLVRDSGELLQASVDNGPLEVQQPVQSLAVIPVTILLFGP